MAEEQEIWISEEDLRSLLNGTVSWAEVEIKRQAIEQAALEALAALSPQDEPAAVLRETVKPEAGSEKQRKKRPRPSTTRHWPWFTPSEAEPAIIPEPPVVTPIALESPVPASIVPEPPATASIAPESPVPASIVPELPVMAPIVPEPPVAAPITPEPPVMAPIVPEPPVAAPITPELSVTAPVTPDLVTAPPEAPKRKRPLRRHALSALWHAAVWHTTGSAGVASAEETPALTSKTTPAEQTDDDRLQDFWRFLEGPKETEPAPPATEDTDVAGEETATAIPLLEPSTDTLVFQIGGHASQLGHNEMKQLLVDNQPRVFWRGAKLAILMLGLAGATLGTWWYFVLR